MHLPPWELALFSYIVYLVFAFIPSSHWHNAKMKQVSEEGLTWRDKLRDKNVKVTTFAKNKSGLLSSTSEREMIHHQVVCFSLLFFQTAKRMSSLSLIGNIFVSWRLLHCIPGHPLGSHYRPMLGCWVFLDAGSYRHCISWNIATFLYTIKHPQANNNSSSTSSRVLKIWIIDHMPSTPMLQRSQVLQYYCGQGLKLFHRAPPWGKDLECCACILSSSRRSTWQSISRNMITEL